MNTLGDFSKSKIDISRELNHARVDSTGDEKLAEITEKQERERIANFVSAQEKEISALRNEISLLKRKDVTQTLPYLPAPPGKGILPPIPSASSNKFSSSAKTKF